jgi:hypothetical protein
MLPKPSGREEGERATAIRKVPKLDAERNAGVGEI